MATPVPVGVGAPAQVVSAGRGLSAPGFAAGRGGDAGSLAKWGLKTAGVSSRVKLVTAFVSGAAIVVAAGAIRRGDDMPVVHDEAGALALAAAPVQPEPLVPLPPERYAQPVATAAKGPPEDPVVELGRRLFFDPGASHSQRTACASCHAPDHGYSDSRVTSDDDFGPTKRHSQPIEDMPERGPLHWDGEFESIEDLVSTRTGDRRMLDVSQGYRGDPSTQSVEVTPVADMLRKSGLYDRAFEAAFGDPAPTRDGLSKAVASYVRTLSSSESAFDRYHDGEWGAMTNEAIRGLALFNGRAGCAQCHPIGGERATFTDGRFHDTGIALHAPRQAKDRDERARQAVPALGPDEGRKTQTKREDDLRTFKTPSLRDVAVRAPYMHDGSFATLASVVRYYAVECGATGDKNLDRLVKPFDANRPADVEGDVRDLVAFLSALTGDTRTGLAKSAWSKRAETMSLKFVEKSGAPYTRVISFAPAGDPVPATNAPIAARCVTPDSEGAVEIHPFATTHVRVSFPGTNLRVATGELVPDTCETATLTVETTPIDPPTPPTPPKAAARARTR